MRFVSLEKNGPLVPNSITRTPATYMLYNTTNGQKFANRNATAQHLDMSRCWDVANFCQLVVNLLYNKL